MHLYIKSKLSTTNFQIDIDPVFTVNGSILRNLRVLSLHFKVIKKAYIEEKSNDGLPDPVAARLAWENHKKRNKSIIVELLQVCTSLIKTYASF